MLQKQHTGFVESVIVKKNFKNGMQYCKYQIKIFKFNSKKYF